LNLGNLVGAVRYRIERVGRKQKNPTGKKILWKTSREGGEPKSIGRRDGFQEEINDSLKK
jgi:hypothetical protein